MTSKRGVCSNEMKSVQQLAASGAFCGRVLVVEYPEFVVAWFCKILFESLTCVSGMFYFICTACTVAA